MDKELLKAFCLDEELYILRQAMILLEKRISALESELEDQNSIKIEYD